MAKFTNRPTVDKTILTEDNIIPVKSKSKPDYHYCYACEEWIFCPIEDFTQIGHYTENRVTTLVEKTLQHRVVFAPLLENIPPKPSYNA